MAHHILARQQLLGQDGGQPAEHVPAAVDDHRLQAETDTISASRADEHRLATPQQQQLSTPQRVRAARLRHGGLPTAHRLIGVFLKEGDFTSRPALAVAALPTSIPWQYWLGK